MSKIYDLVIVGGGASGLMAAIAAAKKNRELSILILEAQEQAGRKILASGNGRCNLSNQDMSAKNYQNNRFVESLLYNISPTVLQYVFSDLGLLTITDSAGRIYPASNQAQTVLAILLENLARFGVDLRTKSPVIRLEQATGNTWQLYLLSGEMVEAKKLILATGSVASPQLGGSRSGFKLLKQLGLNVLDPAPALTPLVLQAKELKQLKGCRFKGKANLLLALAGKEKNIIASSEGEFLLTDYGLSGIAAMELAAEIAKYCSVAAEDGPEIPLKRAKLRAVPPAYLLAAERKLSLEIDFFPQLDKEEIKIILRQRLQQLKQKEIWRIFLGILPFSLGEYLGEIIKEAFQSKGKTSFDQEMFLDHALEILKGWQLNIAGLRGYEQAQISLGGLDTREIDPQSMSINKISGLYIAGELVDLAGDSGGYNLHFAFASGILAGEAAAEASKQ